MSVATCNAFCGRTKLADEIRHVRGDRVGGSERVRMLGSHRPLQGREQAGRLLDLNTQKVASAKDCWTPIRTNLFRDQPRDLDIWRRAVSVE